MVIIIGPTSSGKTSLALKLCQKFNGEIISADSRQVYRDLNIGTGKTPISNNSTVPEYAVVKNDNVWQFNNTKVWGYDVCDLDKTYSVSDFVKDANNFKKQIEANKKMPIMVGGTGYFIESFLFPKLNFDIPPNEVLRKNLESKSVSDLQKMLSKTILKSLNESDIKNKRRLIRQIEIQDYRKERKLKTRNQNNKLPYEDTLILYLTSKREYLITRADVWVDTIWPKLIAEVNKLIKSGYKDVEALNNMIYKEAKLQVLKALSEDDAKNKAKTAIHQYIKRQITYFKKFKTAIELDIQKKDYEKKAFHEVEFYLKRQSLKKKGII